MKRHRSIQEEIDGIDDEGQKESLKELFKNDQSGKLDFGNAKEIPAPIVPNPPHKKDQIPQIRKLENANKELRNLNVRTRPGRGPNFQSSLGFTIRAKNFKPSDAGRIVEVSVINKITSRINSPLTKERQVADTFIENVEIPLSLNPAAMTTHVEARMVGTKLFKLPSDGKLDGQLNLVGNYGTLFIKATLKGDIFTRSVDMAEMKVDGSYEEEERAKETNRFRKEQERISHWTSVVGALRSGLMIVATAIDTFADLTDSIPFLGGVLSLTWKSLKNLITAIQSGLLGIWQAKVIQLNNANKQVRTGNLNLIEYLPESGTPGDREVIH